MTKDELEDAARILSRRFSKICTEERIPNNIATVAGIMFGSGLAGICGYNRENFIAYALDYYDSAMTYYKKKKMN